MIFNNVVKTYTYYMLLIAVGTIALAKPELVIDNLWIVFALTTLGALVYLISVVQRIDWMILLLLLVGTVILVPGRIYKVPIELPFDLEMHRVVAVIVFICWVIMLMLSEQVQIKSTELDSSLLFLWGVALCSIIWNAATLIESEELIMGVKSVIDLASLILIFFFIVSTLEKKEHIEKVLKAIVGLMAFTAIFGVIERFTGYGIFRHLHEYLPFLSVKENTTGATTEIIRGGVRIFGPTGHPIAYSVMLSLVFPLSMYFWEQSKTIGAKFTYGLLTALILLATLFTGSRTGFIGLAIAVFTFLAFNLNNWKRYLILTLSAIFVVHMLFSGTLATLRSTLSPSYIQQTESSEADKGKVGGRLVDYPKIWTEFIGKPLMGRGWGTFDPKKYFFVDNQYLVYAVEIGLLGLIAVGFFFIRLVGEIRKKIAWANTEEERLLHVAWLSIVLVFIFASYTFDIIGFPQVPYLFFIIIGLFAAYPASKLHASSAANIFVGRVQ